MTVIAGTAAACGGGSSAGESDALAKLQKSGVIRVGVFEGKPFSTGDKVPTGYHPEMAALVFKDLGIDKIKIVPMDFGALIPSLQSGRIDAVAAGLSVKPDRCKIVAYATGSMFDQSGIVVDPSKQDASKFTSFDALAKTKVNVGHLTGTINRELAINAGVPESKLQDYPDPATALDALKAGRIDVFTDSYLSSAYEMTKPAYSKLELGDPIVPTVDGKPAPDVAAVAFQKADGDVAKAFSKAQEKLRAAGAFDSIAKKWGLPEDAVNPPASARTVDQICSS